MPTSRRARPAKAPLSVEAVIEAGLHVLREEGIDAVTMRRVAAELDTGPASLYVYVRSREDLLDQMFDAVAADVDVSAKPDPKRWRKQLEELLTKLRHTMDRHPGIARVALANPPTGPNATRVAEHVLTLLRAGGVDDRSAAWFMDVVALYVNAASFEASIWEAEGGAENLSAELEETFGQLDPERYPTMVSLMPYLTAGDADERFAFGIRLMINGLLNTEPPAPG